jgi:hypothetical protein
MKAWIALTLLLLTALHVVEHAGADPQPLLIDGGQR